MTKINLMSAAQDVQFRLKGKFLILPLIAAILPFSTAQAGTATSNFTVSATVLTACLINSAPLVFGNYDPTASSAVTGSTSVTATCTLAAPYTIALSNGSGTGASAAAGASGRKLTQVAGSATLGYNLYQDSAFVNVWGNAAGATMSATGTGLIQSYTVYGRIPAQQSASAGAYLDTVTATLTF